MARRLAWLMWLLMALTACYMMVMIIANITPARNLRMAYMNDPRVFYHDINIPIAGLDGLEPNGAFMFHRNRAFQPMQQLFLNELIDAPVMKLQEEFEQIDKDVDYNNHDSIGDKNSEIGEKQIDLSNNSNQIDRIIAERKVNEQYYSLRAARVNPFDFNFLSPSKSVCKDGETPFLVILCLTKYYDIETRQAIRDTWGSVARVPKWPPLGTSLPLIKLVFLLGSHGDMLVKKTIVDDENNRYGDVIAADFKDSYTNLTLKVMMGLKWVTKYCSHAEYVVKIDQDMFLHVLNLVNFLKIYPNPQPGVVIGFQNTNAKVLRTGKWGVDRKSFPLNTYPNYTNGNCYVISGKAVPDMLQAAERMPYIFIEDAFITGIIRTVVGLEIVDNQGFTRWNDKPPRLCGFHNDFRIAATNTDDERKYSLWKALHYRNLKNCYSLSNRNV